MATRREYGPDGVFVVEYIVDPTPAVPWPSLDDAEVMLRAPITKITFSNSIVNGRVTIADVQVDRRQGAAIFDVVRFEFDGRGAPIGDTAPLAIRLFGSEPLPALRAVAQALGIRRLAAVRSQLDGPPPPPPGRFESMQAERAAATSAAATPQPPAIPDPEVPQEFGRFAAIREQDQPEAARLVLSKNRAPSEAPLNEWGFDTRAVDGQRSWSAQGEGWRIEAMDRLVGVLEIAIVTDAGEAVLIWDGGRPAAEDVNLIANLTEPVVIAERLIEIASAFRRMAYPRALSLDNLEAAAARSRFFSDVVSARRRMQQGALWRYSFTDDGFTVTAAATPTGDFRAGVQWNTGEAAAVLWQRGVPIPSGAETTLRGRPYGPAIASILVEAAAEFRRRTYPDRSSEAVASAIAREREFMQAAASGRTAPDVQLWIFDGARPGNPVEELEPGRTPIVRVPLRLSGAARSSGLVFKGSPAQADRYGVATWAAVMVDGRRLADFDVGRGPDAQLRLDYQVVPEGSVINLSSLVITGPDAVTLGALDVVRRSPFEGIDRAIAPARDVGFWDGANVREEIAAALNYIEQEMGGEDAREGGVGEAMPPLQFKSISDEWEARVPPNLALTCERCGKKKRSDQKLCRTCSRGLERSQRKRKR